MKPYKFIPGGDNQYWPFDSVADPATIKFHFNPASSFPNQRPELEKAFASIERQLRFYFDKPMIVYGGVKSHPKQALDIVNGDFQYNMIHFVLPSDMLKISGSKSTLGFSRISVDQDIIQGVEIWLNIDMPNWGIHQVLIHEITHSRFMLDHSFFAEDVSVMKVNYSSPNDLDQSQSRESYQASDLFGMAAKYGMPSLIGKYWVDDKGSMILPMVGYPIGDPVQYFSVRYRLEKPPGEPARQVIEKVINWDGEWGE